MPAIKAQNISKQYRLGMVGTGTLSHDLNRLWHRLRGKDDPYLKIGKEHLQGLKGEEQYAWALQNINFEIQHGDTVAIVGKNGAGKSTLLKLLSKVTKPSTGHIITEGRIASLLEIGTGFHPEMTGRENVYLNGAILGMSKQEITQKLDTIIAFAEIERYIDTPVKRYSSGMYVRLAFAVAAHLDSEILIIDEVLAVGDAEFQQKCINRIKQLNEEEGRTILFVSHNMHTVNKLCQKAILLEDGNIVGSGSTEDIVFRYLGKKHIKEGETLFPILIKNTGVSITDFKFIQNGYPSTLLYQGEGFECEFTIENTDDKNYDLQFNIELKSRIGEPVTFFGNQFQNKKIEVKSKEKKQIQISFSDLYLRKGKYFVNLFFSTDMAQWPDKLGGVQEAFELKIAKPRASYFDNKNREWIDFSRSVNHGYLPMKMDSLEQKEL